MLWIDVEGALEPVLSGAKTLIQETAAVFVEVESAPFWERQCLPPTSRGI